MKVGIVSDLHCNVAGLAQALDLMGDVDELICLGDSIWEYRFSNEIVQMLKERGAHTILGNHEEGFLGPQGVRARQPDWIDRSLLGWLAERPHRLELQLGGKKLLAVHSTPWEPRGAYVYPHELLLERFGEADADFVLYGHTHHQLVRRNWQSPGDQPGLGRRCPRQRQRPAIELRGTRHRDRGGRGDRFPGSHPRRAGKFETHRSEHLMFPTVALNINCLKTNFPCWPNREIVD